MAKRHRFDSAVTLNRVFQNASGVRISVQTYCNRLHEVNLRARRPAVRPPLTPRHRAARPEFARDHSHWQLRHFRYILFTDKSKFCLDFHDGRTRVWRQRNERFTDCCIAEHDKFGGGSVIVWAGISYGGRTDFHVVLNGTINGRRYIDDILGPYIIPYAGAIGEELY